MSGRETLLAELEAKRREQAEKPVDVLDTEIWPGVDDTGYNPYDNPGHAKPLETDRRKKKLTPRRHR